MVNGDNVRLPYFNEQSPYRSEDRDEYLLFWREKSL